MWTERELKLKQWFCSIPNKYFYLSSFLTINIIIWCFFVLKQFIFVYLCGLIVDDKIKINSLHFWDVSFLQHTKQKGWTETDTIWRITKIIFQSQRVFWYCFIIILLPRTKLIWCISHLSSCVRETPYLFEIQRESYVSITVSEP